MALLSKNGILPFVFLIVFAGCRCTSEIILLPTEKSAVWAKQVADLVEKADRGDGAAVYALVTHFSKVESTDPEVLIKLLRRAAALGSVDAECDLGAALVNMPDYGKKGEGAKLIRSAARKGSEDAKQLLEQLRQAELDEKRNKAKTK